MLILTKQGGNIHVHDGDAFVKLNYKNVAEALVCAKLWRGSFEFERVTKNQLLKACKFSTDGTLVGLVIK